MKLPVTPILFLAVVLAAGCSTLQESPQVNSSTPAEAYTAKLKFDGKFRVDHINGRPTQSLNHADQLRLVPGSHEVGFTLRAYSDEYASTINISVTDHQTLQLKSKREGPNHFVELWNLSDKSGEPVKIATQMLDSPKAINTYARASSDTNGNRPLQ